MGYQTEGHTFRRFDGELNHLHSLVLEMGILVQTQTQQAISALLKRDPEQANSVFEYDKEVNTLEMRIDEEVVNVLAIRCPVAQDLRTVIAISKVVTDLERIGDEAVRIADITLSLYAAEGNEPSSHMLHDVVHMGGLVKSMFQQTMELLDGVDGERAHKLLEQHHAGEFNIEFQSGFRRMATYIMEDHRTVGHAINIILVCKALERIGEHARNIAEFIVYMVKGIDVRHRNSRRMYATG